MNIADRLAPTAVPSHRRRRFSEQTLRFNVEALAALLPAALLARILAREPALLLQPPFGVWSALQELAGVLGLGHGEALRLAARHPRLLTAGAAGFLRDR